MKNIVWKISDRSKFLVFVIAVGTLFIIYAKIANPKFIEEIEKETWENFAQLCGSQENTRNGFLSNSEFVYKVY